MNDIFEDAVERIKKATGARTQVELAAILEIRQSSISDAKRRKSIPADWLLKLYRSHGLNPDWIMEGVQPQVLKEGPATPFTVAEAASPYGIEYPKPKTVSVSAMGAAKSGDSWSERVIGRLPIPDTFARTSLLVVKMDGASMEPIIRKGAYVGLDRDQKNIVSGELYALLAPMEGLAIKRVFIDAAKSQLVLRSEKAGHQDQFVPFQDQAELIVGRVIWVLQDF